MLLFYTLFLTSCEVGLLPFEAYEPLIIDPNFTFDAKAVNNKCEIYYYERSVAEDAYYRKDIKENLIYKAFQEWNETGANVKFTFDSNQNLSNIYLWKDSPNGIPFEYKEDELGLIKINGDINNPILHSYYKYIKFVSPDYAEFNLFGDFVDLSTDERYRRRILLYLIGKYLGLPDSKNKESCMYPYLIKDGSLGKITEEDIALLKQLRPSSPCGTVSIAMKSNALNADGSLDFAVTYSNTNSQSKVANCGIVISEDSTTITVERSAYFLSTSNKNNQEFMGKTTKLNAETTYYARAFSVDANGISYSKNKTVINVPNRLHDKWIPIKLGTDIRINRNQNDYFIYDGKLYTGFETINEKKYLYQVNLLTGEVRALAVDKFPFTYGEFVHVDDYLYYINKEKTSFESDFLFARLSLKTLKWETLKNSSVNQSFGFAISFNLGDNIFIQKNNNLGNTFPLEKYSISTNTWTNVKASGTYPMMYNFPILQNNQFYFSRFKENKFQAYNPSFNEWKSYDLQAQFNISQAETLKMFIGLMYVEQYTVPYQNQLVTYFYNRNELKYLNNSLNNKYELLPTPTPTIYEVINGPYKSYERQSLIALNPEGRNFKNLCNPPEPFRLKHLDDLSYQAFFVSSGEDLYLGFSYDASKCNTIYRYIP